MNLSQLTSENFMKSNITLSGHIFLITTALFFSYQLLSTPTPWIFPDNLNLLIHETGHLIFMPFGLFVHVLAGSVLQILFPCSFLVYFILRREYFSASFILFWIADNIINVSVYMRDAQQMQLPLLGGDAVTHDWNWIFVRTGLLPSAQIIGLTFFVYGIFVLIFSVIGMVWFSYFEYSRRVFLVDHVDSSL